MSDAKKYVGVAAWQLILNGLVWRVSIAVSLLMALDQVVLP